MTDTETLTQLRESIEEADVRLQDARGLLLALQGMMERYDPSTSGDNLTCTPMWNLMLCAQEKVAEASELINPSVFGLRYAVTVEPSPEAGGGGFIATIPDLPGCMSDGATPQEALANVIDAIPAWIEAARDVGHEVPQPPKHHAAA
jgi:antitoxin HicB